MTCVWISLGRAFIRSEWTKSILEYLSICCENGLFFALIRNPSGHGPVLTQRSPRVSPDAERWEIRTDPSGLPDSDCLVQTYLPLWYLGAAPTCPRPLQLSIQPDGRGEREAGVWPPRLPSSGFVLAHCFRQAAIVKAVLSTQLLPGSGNSSDPCPIGLGVVVSYTVLGHTLLFWAVCEAPSFDSGAFWSLMSAWLIDPDC